MDKLAEWTNKYTELHPSNDAGEKLRAHPWQPTCKELWAYFGVLIRIGLTQESSIEDYWGSLRIDQYYQLRISNHDDFNALI